MQRSVLTRGTPAGDWIVCLLRTRSTKVLHSHGDLEKGNQRQLTSVGLPVCLQGILLRELCSALITDKGFGTR